LIANKYDVAVAEIKKWNGLRGNTIYGEKFKNHHYRNRGSNRKKETKALASVDVKVVKAVKITEVRTDTLAANTATVYIVQGDNLTTIAQKEQCYC
jgi:membrane-bound lytic murein transglycosylase D